MLSIASNDNSVMRGMQIIFRELTTKESTFVRTKMWGSIYDGVITINAMSLIWLLVPLDVMLWGGMLFNVESFKDPIHVALVCVASYYAMAAVLTIYSLTEIPKIWRQTKRYDREMGRHYRPFVPGLWSMVDYYHVLPSFDESRYRSIIWNPFFMPVSYVLTVVTFFCSEFYYGVLRPLGGRLAARGKTDCASLV